MPLRWIVCPVLWTPSTWCGVLVAWALMCVVFLCAAFLVCVLGTGVVLAVASMRGAGCVLGRAFAGAALQEKFLLPVVCAFAFDHLLDGTST